MDAPIPKQTGEISAFVKPSIEVETLILTCDNPPEILLQINRNIESTSSFNEDTIPSTAEFQLETCPITIDMDPYQKTLEKLMKISRRNIVVL